MLARKLGIVALTKKNKKLTDCGFSLINPGLNLKRFRYILSIKVVMPFDAGFPLQAIRCAPNRLTGKNADDVLSRKDG